ncbi:hypothetical protein ACTNBM_06695 [Lachnospiraceae bacterium HCP1S3_C3]|nr:hypothetical protein [Lachnospiraceae bacterium]
MNAYFYYFYNFMRQIFDNLYNLAIAFKDCVLGILDIQFYQKLANSYYKDLSPLGWIAYIITHILIYLLIALVLYLLFKALKVALRFKVPVVKYEQMKDEVVTLKREIMKANYEKDKILAMKVSEMGLKVDEQLLEQNPELNAMYSGTADPDQMTDEEIAATMEEEAKNKTEENENAEPDVNVINAETEGEVAETVEDTDDENKVEKIVTSELRFPRLSSVDRVYMAPDFKPFEYNKTVTLEEICINFRNFAASRLHLYYELDVIKQTFATFGAAKMLILQGISGTGKTSLPYALGQYLQNPSLICSVQPSWRDRTELFGYYNDFTKKYTETDFLKAIYEAQYYDGMKLIILDEMNIARVEYYFAEMLSILELPREDERYVTVVSSETDSDPEKMVEGKVWIPSNVWYVGTINNDDSTFAVSDKVYDRAIPIDLDARAEVFEAPDTEPMRLSFKHMEEMYEEAKQKYPISEEYLLELDKLDQYLIEHFRLTFGNRILRQMKAFVPCYVACGGTEIDGIDFMFAKKILRKFESLGLGFIRDELDGLIIYLNNAFGEENFKISKEYLTRLKKMSGAM